MRYDDMTTEDVRRAIIAAIVRKHGQCACVTWKELARWAKRYGRDLDDIKCDTDYGSIGRSEYHYDVAFVIARENWRMID